MRALTERRKKACPLKDTAGMLRSFDYAASVSANMWNLSQEKEPSLSCPGAEKWHHRVRSSFLKGYMDTVLSAKPSFFPEDPAVALKLITFFEIDRL